MTQSSSTPEALRRPGRARAVAALWLTCALGAVESSRAARSHAGSAGDGDELHGRAAFQAPKPSYHDHAEVCALVNTWVAADERVQRVELGSTREGREVPAFRFGAGAGSSAQSRTVLLIGGLDGRSQAGCEAVLWSAWEFLGELDHLPPDLSMVVIPWGAPDGLARTHGGADLSGRSAAPTDDDGDRSVDEDGADDLDGDGMVLDMVIADPEGGRWCFSEDHRFLVPASPGDAPRYSLTREGRDDDLDGSFNEDGPGGVDFNAHFPVGWSRVRDSAAYLGASEVGGAWPLSEPVARRIADLCLSEDIALCISFVGTHGGLDFGRVGDGGGKDAYGDDPCAVAPEVERRIRLAFERVTGRLRCDSMGMRTASGRLVDWLGTVRGCVAMELAVWGPDVVGVDGRPFEARSQRMAAQVDRSMDALETGRPLGAVDAAWAYWLDDVQGGAGFHDWHPVDLGRGVTGWVGGWEPRTRVNPPEEILQASLEGISRFVHEISLGLPRIEVDVLNVERIGDLVQIDAQVTNRGGLETKLVRGESAGEVTVSLHRVEKEEIVAGAAVTRLDQLGPGESSRTLRWLIQAKPGAAVQIRASAAFTPVVVREVRP
ncbi:MAG: M14 family zinc carboxypeptidase [Planctomycetota bacterium]